MSKDVTQGYRDAHEFDPDRFGPERKEDMTCAKYFLTFGFGPHYCVGHEYATNHLIVYLAILATRCTRTCSSSGGDLSEALDDREIQKLCSLCCYA